MDPTDRYVVCLSSEGYPASLEVRKIYAVTPDPDAEKAGMIRVVDESGEDYLYPARMFAAIELSPAIASALSLPT